jgi:hypothetical protein
VTASELPLLVLTTVTTADTLRPVRMLLRDGEEQHVTEALPAQP